MMPDEQILLTPDSRPRLRVDCVSGHTLYFVPDQFEKTSYQRQSDNAQFSGGTRALLRVSTRYNCFGLVLGKRKGWLDDFSDENILAALVADGYRRVPDPRELLTGDVVLYSRGQQFDHIALVIGLHTTLTDNVIGTDEEGRDILVVSKFGDAGEYRHALHDVPVDRYGKPVEYWTLDFRG